MNIPQLSSFDLTVMTVSIAVSILASGFSFYLGNLYRRRRHGRQIQDNSRRLVKIEQELAVLNDDTGPTNGEIVKVQLVNSIGVPTDMIHTTEG